MDENNLDPEQIRQLNEAFAELKEVVSSTTDNLKSNDLKTGMDKIKSSSEQIKNELDKFNRLLKNLNKNLESQPKPESQGKGKDSSPQTNTSAFENIVKGLSGNLSGLNNATLNLIKSFGNLDELVKDKTGSKTKISERLRERTQNITAKNIEDSPTVAPENITVNIPEIPAPAQPVKPAGPDYDLLSESKITIERLQEFASQLNESDKALLRNTGYIRAGENTWKKYSSLMEVAIKKQELLINPVDKQLEQLESVVRGYGYIKDENDKWITTTRELTAEQKLELEERTKVLEGLAKEGRLRKEKDDRDQARKKAEEDLIKNFKELAKVAGTDLAKNFFDSSKGMGKYGETLDKFGGGIIDATKNLGPLGRAAGLAAGGLFKLVGATLKQNEVLNKAYETLSEFGAVDAGGIAQMFKNLQNAGFPVEQIDKFTNILKQAGPNLAFLGTTAAEGAKRVSDTFASIKNTGVEEQLRMLGYNSETLFKTFTDYQGLMGRLGFAQNRSVAELSRNSTQYAKTLDELAKLTGETRDEMQKRQEAAAADLKFRIYMTQVSEDTAKKIMKGSAIVEEFGPVIGQGFRDMIASAGNVTTDAAQKLMLSTGGAAQDIINKFRKGDITEAEMARQIALAQEKTLKQYGVNNENMANALTAGEGVAEELGFTAKSIDAINKYRNKTQEQVEALDKEQTEQMKKSNDSQRAAEVARSMTERNFEQAKDRLVQLVGKGVTGAFEKLMTVINGFGKWLANIVAKMGGPDLRDLFDSTDDIAKSLKETETKLQETNKQIEQAANARKTYEATQAQWLEKAQERQKLEEELRNTKDAATRKEIATKLETVKQEENILNAKSRQAYSEAQTAGQRLKILEKQKKELEEKRTGTEKRLMDRGGYDTTMESPELQQIKQKAEDLYKQKTNLEELIADKSKLLYEQTLKKLGYEEKDLQDKEKRAEFEKAYSDKRKQYEAEKSRVDQELLELDKKRVQIVKEETDRRASDRPQTPAAPKLDSTAGAGRGTSGMPVARAEEGVEVAGAKKSNMADYLKKVAQVESSGSATAKAGTSSASGLFQFTEGTWKEMTRAMGKNYSLQDRFDPVKATEVAAFMTKQRKSKVEEAIGRETNDTDVYLSHFLGEAGAIKFLKALDRNPNALSNQGASDDQIRANLNVFTDKLGRLKTLQEVYDSFSKKLDTAETVIAKGKGGRDIAAIDQANIQQAKLGGMFSGPDSGYPVLLHGREIVIPMPDTTNIGAQLAQVTKTALDSTTPSPITPSINLDPFRDIAMNQESMIETLISKLDEMIGKLSTSNDIQDKILTYQQT